MKINMKKIILSILILLVMLPSTLSIFGISIYKICCMFSIFTIFYLLGSEKIKKKIFKNLFFIFNCILSFFILITFIFINDAKINDYLEIIRFITMAFITIDVIIICKEEKYFVFLLKGLCITTMFMAVLGIIQYFNPLHINEKYIYLYAPTQYKTLINNYPYPRIVSTKPNPAVYGFIAAIGIFAHLMYYKYYKHKIIGIISIIIIFISLMMTLSRTTQIACLISIVVYSFFKMVSKKGWIKSIFLLLIEILIIFMLLNILPESLTWRLTQIKDLSSTSSWIDRTEKWKSYGEIIKDNILIGIGPVKNLVDKMGYVDSEFVQMLLQYGIIGFTIYIIMLFSPLINKIKNNKNILIYYAPILSLILITNISSITMLSFDTSVIIYIMIGIIVSKTENLKEIEDINK